MEGLSMKTVLRTSGGVLDAQDQAAFAAFLARIGTGSPRILLHLHGGLVDRSAAEKMADRLSGVGDTAYNVPGHWEQVYVVWRTGALETLAKNWIELAANDRLYNAILKRLLSFISRKVGVEARGGRSLALEGWLTPATIQKRLASGSDNPFGDVDDLHVTTTGTRSAPTVDANAEDELALELESDTELEEAAGDIEQSLATRHPAVTRSGAGGNALEGEKSFGRLDPRIQEEFEGETREAVSTRGIISGEIIRKVVVHGVKIGTRVIRRYREERDHGLHATIVEEIAREFYGDLIGSAIWGMMKGDASEHFAAGGLGAPLFGAIADNPQARLLIVAHSAGSIFASDLLLWAEKHKPSFSAELVFLAPAVRTSKFAAALDASEARILRFRMFAMQDTLERRDVLLGKGRGYIYPSSLLYLVSGLFEEGAVQMSDAPLLGMQRFLGANSSWLRDASEGPALKRVQDFLAGDPHRTVFAEATGGDGLNCGAKSHGAFDDEVATLKSVATFFA
jgi:hypothetical protein